jgi:hypothetical protein
VTASENTTARYAWIAVALVAALALLAGGAALGVALSGRDDEPAAAAAPPAPATTPPSSTAAVPVSPTTIPAPSSTSTTDDPPSGPAVPAVEAGDPVPPAADDGADPADDAAPPEPDAAPPAPTIFVFAVSHPINCAGGGPTVHVTWESTNAVLVELAIGGGAFTPTPSLNGTLPASPPCAGPVGICARARNADGVVALQCTQANL